MLWLNKSIAVKAQEPVRSEGLRLFPNPVKDRLNWTFGTVAPSDYRWLDMQGRTLPTGSVTEADLGLRNLPQSFVIQLAKA
jgi:hypothetical protein